MINVKDDVDINNDNDIFNIQPFPKEMVVYQGNACDDKEIYSIQEENCIKQEEQQLTLHQLFQCVFNLSTKQIINDVHNVNHYDLQMLSYSYLKRLSKLRINKEESFMIRMLFDIMKRQSQERNLLMFLKQHKAKMKEEERVKGFNRLIQDANRRLETQERIDELKNKIENSNSNQCIKDKTIKRYKSKQWKEVYERRFKKYQDDKEEKIKKKISERKEMERLKEEEEVKMCKRIKAPRKVTEMYGNRLYSEGMKGKEVNYNGKAKERKMQKDVIRKGKILKKEIIKEDNNNNIKMDNGFNGVNNKEKCNKRVNSFAIPKLNVEDFIISKSDNDFSDDNNYNYNYNYNNKDYGNINIIYSLDNNNHNNSNILSEFFTKNNT